MRPFEWAQGTVPGRNHVGGGRLLVGKNNQDACYCTSGEQRIVAVICDGCGSGAFSECGAQWGARLIARSVALYTPDNLPDEGPAARRVLEHRLEWVRRDVLAQLQLLACQLGDDPASTVHDYFLFTVLGALVLPEWTTVFSLGDGVFSLNGQLTRLGPFPGNAPPYLAYALTSNGNGNSDGANRQRICLQRMVPTGQLDSLLLGSDGVDELVNAEHRLMPGSAERVGPIDRFWEDDRYFANPDAIRRRLALINSERVRLVPETGRLQRSPGLLPDDTTMIVIRRKRI